MIRVLNVTSSESSGGGAEALLLGLAREHDRNALSLRFCNLFFDRSD